MCRIAVRLIAVTVVMSAPMVFDGPEAGAVPSRAPAPVQGVDDGLQATVRASTSLQHRLYVGGSFASAGGRAHHNTAAIDMNSRLVDHGWNVSTNGRVHAMAAAPDGSAIYIGGDFTIVNGVRRPHFAVVHPDTGALLADQIDVNGSVQALAVHGTRVYIGGDFNLVDGVLRRRLVAIDDGHVHPGWRVNANGRVRDLKLSRDGATLYVAGSFSTLDGTPAPGRVGRVRATDGARLPLAIGFQNSYTVLDLAVAEDGSTLYMAVGGPPSIGGNRTRAVRIADGALLWQYDHESDSQALLLDRGTLYVGGHFDLADANDGRARLKALDARTGGLLGWVPQVNSVFGVWDLDASRWGLVAVGDFTVVDGAPHGHLAVYDDVVFADPTTPVASCSATVHPSGRVIIRWDPWLGEQSYMVRRDGNHLARVDGGGLAHTDRQASPGDHTYVVRAQERGVLADIPCGRVTVPVPDMTCTTVRLPNGRFLVKWTSWPGEDDFIVRRDGQYLAHAAHGARSYVDADPPPGTRVYAVRVKENGIIADIDCGRVLVPRLF